ncbi:PITH domain-containing protein, partial [Kockiozyma suomiensis]|uniref:PITH domain-containing protein n=1 Tax=Kockiozyma suomiensis TaxID=1337062 RepID=UPI003343C8EC
MSYQKFIPAGFELLNDTIELKSLEALNLTVGRKGTDEVESVRSVFSAPSAESSAVSVCNIESDSDSQLLFYVQLMNVAKVHSILIQSAVSKKSDGAEESADEVRQRPTKIKVWTNLPSILSFDDVNSVPTVYEEDEISEADEQGWSSVKLRYVRFQRVTSLVIYLEGEDDDEPTGINRILFVGDKGQTLAMGKLETHDHD